MVYGLNKTRECVFGWLNMVNLKLYWVLWKTTNENVFFIWT